jgi:hypothetical protein
MGSSLDPAVSGGGSTLKTLAPAGEEDERDDLFVRGSVQRSTIRDSQDRTVILNAQNFCGFFQDTVSVFFNIIVRNFLHTANFDLT